MKKVALSGERGHGLSLELHLGKIWESPEHSFIRYTDVETSGNTMYGGGAGWGGACSASTRHPF